MFKNSEWVLLPWLAPTWCSILCPSSQHPHHLKWLQSPSVVTCSRPTPTPPSAPPTQTLDRKLPEGRAGTSLKVPYSLPRAWYSRCSEHHSSGWLQMGATRSHLTLMQLLRVSGGSDSKASAYNVGDLGLISGLGRSPGERNGNPLQYSCLENPIDGGAWRATVHEAAKSGTQLKWLNTYPHIHKHAHINTQHIDVNTHSHVHKYIQTRSYTRHTLLWVLKIKSRVPHRTYYVFHDLLFSSPASYLSIVSFSWWFPSLQNK